jgi:protein gp37
MSIKSSIEWTQNTWNPVTGCTECSPGCAHCYAKRMAKRLQAMGQPNYANGFKVTLHPEMLDVSLRWKKPRMIFVNSMSDLFHEAVPIDFIKQVFLVMCLTQQHWFQILTKRSNRLAEVGSSLPWSPNIWMGVSVEKANYTFRIDHLRSTGAAIKFLSLEPLLGPISNLNLEGIDWVIVGGESGPIARPMDPAWVTEIRDQCVTAGVPFFFKQWGKISNNPDLLDPTEKRNGGHAKGGRLLDGRIWNEMPLTNERVVK